VSNHQKWKRIRPRIKSLLKEAIAVLKEYKFPTSSTKLMKFKKEPPDRLALEATLVVHAGYYLYQSIKSNRANEAAIRMFNLCVAYSNMVNLRYAPKSEEWMKLKIADENKALGEALQAGMKNLVKNKNRENAILPEKIKDIRARALQLRDENPDHQVQQIKDILVEEFGISPSSIEKMKKLIPKRSPKKKK